VPVSLEGVHDFWNYYGRCAWHFPFSCPSCPYYGGTYGSASHYHAVSQPHEAEPLPEEIAPEPEMGDVPLIPEPQYDDAPSP
jgi:hypothetical protein